MRIGVWEMRVVIRLECTLIFIIVDTMNEFIGYDFTLLSSYLGRIDFCSVNSVFLCVCVCVCVCLRIFIPDEYPIIIPVVSQ